MDALQQVRKQLKTDCVSINENTKSVNKTNDEKMWTTVELSKRSRYILFKMQTDWEEEEKEIMRLLLIYTLY